jgi:hypothetical protein
VAAEACIEKAAAALLEDELAAAALLEDELAAALVEEGARRGWIWWPKQDVLGHFRSYRAWEMYKFRVKLAKCTARISNRLCTVEISP